jgi:zinc transporter ZupT
MILSSINLSLSFFYSGLVSSLGIYLLKCKIILVMISRSYFTTNFKLIGIANAFSGGIFLCVALLHLLPESAEIFEEYFQDKTSIDEEGQSLRRHFPASFILAFVGYTIILILEKVIFDSHMHSDSDDDEEADDNDGNNQGIFENKLEKEKEIQQVNVNNNFNVIIPVRDLKKNSFNINENNIKQYLEYNNYLNSQSDIRTRSVSMLSKGKRDRIKSYLETFKLDTLEKNEEHFKNLFSTSGKITSMLMDKDSIVLY